MFKRGWNIIIIHVWLHHSDGERQKIRKETHKHMVEPHNLKKGTMSNHDPLNQQWRLDIFGNAGVGLTPQEFVGSP